MKFGVCLPNYGKTASKQFLVSVAKQAESLSYDSIWSTDHLLMPSENKDPYGKLIEAVAALIYLAPLTERVKLGTSVIVLPMRDPVLLAKQLVALDVLSDGRLILGVGVGWNEKEYGFLRADFQRRGRVADEWLKAMKVLWSEANPSFQGRYVKFSDVVFEPKPVQKGGPPIWVGGRSDSALKRTLRFGDAWHPVGVTPEDLRSGAEKLKSYGSSNVPSLTARLRVRLDASAVPYYTSRGQRVFGLAGDERTVTKMLEEYSALRLEHLVAVFDDENQEFLLKQMRLFSKNIIPSFHR